MTGFPMLPGETLSTVWLRRSLTIPAYLSLFLVASLTLPLWLGLVALWDSLGADGRMPRTRCSLFLFLYLASEVWGLLMAFLVWARFSTGCPQEYRRRNYDLQALWATSIFRAAKWLFQVKVDIDGQSLAGSPPYLLLVRHTSLADTVLAATFISRVHRVGLRYVLKKELLWDPCLDVVGRRLPNHFLDRNSHDRVRELESLRSLTRDLSESEGLLIYPEGTRFSPARRQRALERLQTRGQATLAEQAAAWHHVLPPRPGGVLALLDANPGLDLVVLCHTGFEGTARWPNFWRGDLIGKTLKIKLTRVPARDIPTQQRVEWLFDLWGQVNAWVEENYES